MDECCFRQQRLFCCREEPWIPAEVVAMGDLSSWKIESDRAVADLFSHGGGRQQSRKSGVKAAIEQTKQLAACGSGAGMELRDLPTKLAV